MQRQLEALVLQVLEQSEESNIVLKKEQFDSNVKGQMFQLLQGYGVAKFQREQYEIAALFIKAAVEFAEVGSKVLVLQANLLCWQGHLLARGIVTCHHPECQMPPPRIASSHARHEMVMRTCGQGLMH